MSRNGNKSRVKTFATLGAVLLLLALAASGFTMARTSSTQYCVSCHEMQVNLDELKKSSHAVDKDKKPLECLHCHIPHALGPRYLVIKTYVGLKDVLMHQIADLDNLNRRGMQDASRRFVPDENCLACHPDLYKNAKADKAISEFGKLAHEAYLGKNGNTTRNCAGCHQNMAHLPVFDRWYEVNAKFANRLAEGQEQAQAEQAR